MEKMDISYPEVKSFLDRHIIQTMAEADAPYGPLCVCFHLSRFTNDWITKEMARAIVRDLTDRGMCRYAKGLMNEDGEVVGSGYGLTQKGLNYYEEICPDIQPANFTETKETTT